MKAKQPGKRSYDDGCGAAHALDLVGERWALLIVRELLLGPKRFTDLRAGLPAISPNVLTQRLEELERAGILRRRKLLPPAGAWVYELTEWGLDLEPVIMALGRWGARSPYHPTEAPLSADALIISFRTMFDSRAAAGVDASIELRLGEDRFHARIAACVAEELDFVIQCLPFATEDMRAGYDNVNLLRSGFDRTPHFTDAFCER